MNKYVIKKNMVDSWDTEQKLLSDLLHKDDNIFHKNYIQYRCKDFDNIILNPMLLLSKKL